MKSLLLATLILAAATQTLAKPAAQSAIDPALAAQYFREAEAVSRQDSGRLWGVLRATGGVMMIRRNGFIVGVRVPAPGTSTRDR